MHRTQISLEEPLYEELRRRAFERRVSMAQMVREALVEYLGYDPTGAEGAATEPDESGLEGSHGHAEPN